MTVQDNGYRLGFDIGGTFTDFVLVEPAHRRLHLHKCLTTPDDPSVGAMQGMAEMLERLDVPFGRIEQIVHGTTLVTNAIIERRGCRLGFLTTRGFRDILEMGTEQRYDIHDLFLQYPEPLAPRRLRREIDERIDSSGQIVTPLDPDQARGEIRALVDDGVEAFAVCPKTAVHCEVHDSQARAAYLSMVDDGALTQLRLKKELPTKNRVSWSAVR